MLELQKGNIPDIVIFYDGSSDIFSAWQQGVAGLPENEFNRRKEFQLSLPQNNNAIQHLIFQNLIKNSYTVFFGNILLKRLNFNIASGSEKTPSLIEIPSDGKADAPDLFCDIINKYLKNADIVNALSKEYGFKVLFYWHPMILQKSKLTDFEISVIKKMSGEKKIFFEQAYSSISKQLKSIDPKYELIKDLSHIFTETEQSIFIDSVHINRIGNEKIAERIAKDIRKII